MVKTFETAHFCCRVVIYECWKQFLENKKPKWPQKSQKVENFLECWTSVTFLCNFCVLSEFCRGQNVGIRSTTTKLRIQIAFFMHFFEDVGSKLAQNWPQKLKMSKFLLVSDIFRHFFIWNWKVLTGWKLRIASNCIPIPRLGFQRKLCTFHGWKFSQMTKNCCSTTSKKLYLKTYFFRNFLSNLWYSKIQAKLLGIMYALQRKLFLQFPT